MVPLPTLGRITMADFLLELRSEEIPARMQAKARNDLARLFAECTAEAGLSTGAVDVHSTPRRLVLIARDVAASTEAAREELKGPRANAPEQALDGFLRKTGLKRDELEDRDGVLFAVIERPGRAASEVLSETIKRIVADFPWPKSMRWSDGALRWVRPLHGIIAILGEDIVPIEIDGIASSATTFGHRFHHPGPITIGGAHDYVEKLRACHVIIDQEERERLIREGASAAATKAGLTLLEDESLVVENAGLTEWPVPLIGRFDDDFLDVPREVIVLTMRTNQKYFACTNDQGLLAPAFVCVANVDANDGGEAIARGNARVLAARLADARFFWEQDVKIPLEAQAGKLDGIVFHEKLGTVADKVERVAKLARWLVEEGVVKGAKPEQVERAARLAKADLVTGMVGEFPELQGVVGGYLAKAQGEPKAIAEAIRDQYKPTGQGDEVPSASITVAVSLADKLDSILSFFVIDERPTGSKDPFALRRSAIGAIALILRNNLRLNLIAILLDLYIWFQDYVIDELKRENVGLESEIEFREQLLKLMRYAVKNKLALLREPLRSIVPRNRFKSRFEELRNLLKGVKHAEQLSAEIMLFFADRLKVQQREAGVRHDLIDAVFALGDEDDLVRLLARVKALQEFVGTDDGTNLLVAYKRAANILKKEKWEGTNAPGDADLEPQEKALIDILDKAEPKASQAIEKENFTGAMAALATLRKPIDSFFDHVTVNDPDKAKRERRLNLLLRFRDAVNRVADFSRIEG
jgi:glycyl-tRNA synthetase beta chain